MNSMVAGFSKIQMLGRVRVERLVLLGSCLQGLAFINLRCMLLESHL